MARKVWYVKLAAFLAAAALVLSASFGNIRLLNASALAEEAIPQAAETEADPQIIETADASGEAESADPQAIGPEEETAPQAAEEAEPQNTEAEEETEPQEAVEAALQATDAEEETAPQAAETEEETAPQVTESEEGTEPETESEPESAAEPEDHQEAAQPEAPAGDDDDGNKEIDNDYEGVDGIEGINSNEGIDGNEGIVDPEEEEDLAVFEDDDAGTVSEEILEPFNNPDLYEQEEYAGTAEILLVNEGMLNYGDEIILKADVRDVNVSYRLVWEANDNDGRDWFTVASGEEYRFILTPENAAREYRVEIFAVD